jgi:lipoprotein NlpD
LRIWLAMALIVWTILLVGCSSSSAPIVSREQPPSEVIKTHRVERGDTLYSIAWRYDYSVGSLAKANRLSPPYVLREGQVLSLDISKQTQIKSSNTKKSSDSKDLKKTTKSSAQSNKKALSNQWLKKANAGNLHWQKPVNGQIIESYDPKSLRKGIVFQATKGSAVQPAAKGVVVYAGDGLRDYGKLVIIKHSDYLLSAYGHNQELLVTEGQIVDASEIISKLSLSGRLYFEIRKDGKPVNPKAYLD